MDRQRLIDAARCYEIAQREWALADAEVHRLRGELEDAIAARIIHETECKSAMSAVADAVKSGPREPR